MNTAQIQVEKKLKAEIQALRKDFPSLKNEEIYLDSAATSLTPMSVVEAMQDYYFNFNANVNRGVYRSSAIASQKYEDSLEKIARFIGANADELIITANATLALNLLALSLDFMAGDEIILSTIEHTANMLPWVRLVNKAGVKVKWWNPDKMGIFDLEELDSLITEKTKIVSITHISNLLGTISPLEGIANMCHRRGVLFCLDACQSIPHIKIDVKKIGCDFMAFSGHKMLGPTGVGGLYISKIMSEKLEPAILGSDSLKPGVCPGLNACAAGGMPEAIWTAAGTPPIPETIGLAKAIEYIEKVGFKWIEHHDRELLSLALDGLKKIPAVEIYGSMDLDLRSSILAFNIANLPNEEVGRMLSENFNIAVRAGTHCAVGYFMETQADKEVYGNVRASFYLYNTHEEVQSFLEAVSVIAETCV